MSSTEDKYNKLIRAIGANLKKARKSKDLSQADMTEFGFELRYYQRLESGTHSLNLFTLQRLAIIFDCDVSDFLK
ncbi:MAG: hypothetical protein A2622_09525 [Bdellovibrionales bacterium RIFCSPHIGHO2_01_FULL_40_29]|nr:MAG: hypothetical protein A2622_09525 [Bdellovibrionales bacterium RIFCSPHIGHO2_01_FULL_40_29]OFZ33537.1 MAG: hypothetical protein A3D17_00095 [Bdellovibrionales bacterium RIFCSPHIGHO2_02_FULL_40_15]